MPAPYRTWPYRGYKLVQWAADGNIEVHAGGEYTMYLTSEPTLEDAEALVDSYLHAP